MSLVNTHTDLHTKPKYINNKKDNIPLILLQQIKEKQNSLSDSSEVDKKKNKKEKEKEKDKEKEKRKIKKRKKCITKKLPTKHILYL